MSPCPPIGCDDLISAVFELGRTLCRLQLSDEELALFTAAVLLSPGVWGHRGGLGLKLRGTGPEIPNDLLFWGERRVGKTCITDTSAECRWVEELCPSGRVEGGAGSSHVPKATPRIWKGGGKSSGRL